MTVSDIKHQLSFFTDYELVKIIEAVAKERDERALAKREELTKAFVKAWKDLADAGIEIYFENEPVYLEDLDFE